MPDETYTLPEQPLYHELIRRLQNTDEANADTILNPLIQTILENIQFVKSTADGKADANHEHEQYVTSDNASELLGDSLSPSDIDAAAASDLTTHTGNAAIHRASSGLRLTLTTAGWTGSGTSYSQTVNAAGVTTAGNEVVLVYPANKASRLLWQDNGVAANDITTNGKLTFEAESKPSGSISVIVEVKDIGLT